MGSALAAIAGPAVASDRFTKSRRETSESVIPRTSALGRLAASPRTGAPRARAREPAARDEMAMLTPEDDFDAFAQAVATYLGDVTHLEPGLLTMYDEL